MKPLLMFFVAILLLSSGCAPQKPQPTPTATLLAPTATLTAIPSTPTQAPIPRKLLPVRGVVGPFERRGYPSGYAEGQVIKEFNDLDPVLGTTIAQEVELQLDAMRSMGINTLTFSLSAADAQPGPFVPPECTINPDLGLLWPQPTDSELANLAAFFDLVHGKGIQIFLVLSNTHMEDQANSEIWLGSILEVVKNHPALGLVLFGGDAHTHDYNGDGTPDVCGGRAEPNLWEGPTQVGAQYVKWAISYAHSLGLPYQKLSAEAILGSYISVAQQPNPYMTEGHFWNPEEVLKDIFDDLEIPDDQRTYAISFYEQHKCTVASDLPCENVSPHEWAIETITRLFDAIGRNNGARVVAVETGYLTPEVTDWNTELALESLVWIYQNYGVEGGSFWLWTNLSNAEELDPMRTPPIKQRGIDFTYNPVKDVLQELYTQGQTDDLNLTPETVSPVFASASTMPTAVQNGDTLEISADLGETHLFVWVEISALDSGRTERVVLMDQGNGTYSRQVTISPWNVDSNGVKSLKITAMDFWSNATTTSVEVELKNPAPVLDAVLPNDTFDGSVLALNKWKPDFAGGTAATQDGRLAVSTSSSDAYSVGNIFSAWQFSGDFDVQVDYQIGEGWNSPTEGHLDGAVMGVNIAGQSYWITRLRSGGEDKVFCMNSADTQSGEMATSAVSGKYRLIRTGTSLMILFDLGVGWQKIISLTVPTNPAQIYIGNGSINASQAFTTYFDNFKINTGLTTYKP